jgi:outer membrane protein assembly factor BamB
MAKRLAGFSPLLLLAASLALGAEEKRKTWIDEVRTQVDLFVKTFSQEMGNTMAGMRRAVTDIRDGAAKAWKDIPTEGRRGLGDAHAAVSEASTRTFRGAHDAAKAAANTIAPMPEDKPGTKPGGAATVKKIDSPVLSPVFLRGHDIILAWHLDTGGQPIRSSTVLDDRLLLETQGRDLYSFVPQSGMLQWLFALPGTIQGEIRDDPDHVAFIARDTLFELDRTIGRPHRRIVLQFPASNTPTLDEELVLINSWERRVYALHRETRVKEWTYVPDENVTGAVAVSGDMLYAGDVGGNLAAYSSAEHREQWSYKALDAIRVSLVLDGDDILFPAEDLRVHCVNRFGGRARWKFPVRRDVTQPVWIDGDAVYFAAEGDAFYAVSRKDGDLLWSVPKGGWPVAVGKENLYIQGADREIWCLNRKTGAKQWAVSAAPFSYFVRNTTNDHFYLCTDRGEIYAFYVRGDHLEKKAPPPEKEKKPGPRKPKEPGVEEPGTTAPAAVGKPAPPPRRPAPRPAPPKKPEEGEEPKPAPKPEAKPEEAPPAEKEKPSEKPAAKPAEKPGWRGEAPPAEKPPAELDEEAEKAKKPAKKEEGVKKEDGEKKDEGLKKDEGKKEGEEK